MAWARGGQRRFFLLLWQDFLHHPCHLASKGNAHHGHNGVKGQVEHDDLAGQIWQQLGGITCPQASERHHQQHANDLENQITQGHLAGLYIGLEGGDHGQQAAAQVGTNDQAQCHIHGNAARRCQG